MEQPAAIITGAAGAIGAATAVELHRLGYRLALVGRTQGTLDETRRRVAPSALAVAADVTRPADVNRAVAAALEALGRIDALVNVAGYAPELLVEQTTDQEWHKIIDTNLSSAFYMSRAAWPSLAKSGGVIVNVSSMAARDPFNGLSAYGAAKAGLNLLSLGLARQGKDLGIRVHVVAPGAVETPMFRKLRSPQEFPTHLTLQPADVARVIGQCVAGDLRYTSGEVIYIHKT
jgi:NAD(P)-dependent dehydrogenase (short-subunit alcohol dehydrogenase family)